MNIGPFEFPNLACFQGPKGSATALSNSFQAAKVAQTRSLPKEFPKKSAFSGKN